MLIYRRTHHPICNLRVVFNAGSAVEKPDDYGTAHFLEHLFFQGTMSKSAKQLHQLRGRYGDFNAYTSYEKTVFHASFLAEDFDRVSNLLGEMILSPALNPADVEKEKNVIVEELRTRAANPMNFAFEEMSAHAIGPTSHKVAGTEETVRAMTRDKLLAFRRENYTRDRMAVSFAGSTEESYVRSFQEDLSRSLAPSDSPITDMRPYSVHSWQVNKDDFRFHHPTKQAVLLMVWPGFSLQQQAECHEVGDIMALCLGGGAYSMLYQRLREELSLCYSAWAQSWDHRLGGLVYVGVQLDEANVPKAIDEINGIISQSINGALGESFEMARADQTRAICRTGETTNGIAHHGDFAFHLTQNALNYYMDFGARRESMRHMRAGDVQQMAQRIFAGVTPKIVVMTHAKEGE